MSYSRTQPSPHYDECIRALRAQHAALQVEPDNTAYKTLRGENIYPYTGAIRRLIALTHARDLIDYGSGQGFQYKQPVVTIKNRPDPITLMQLWGITNIECYDPAFMPFSNIPPSARDGVLCVDVLQHIPPDDLLWVTQELFSLARSFVFAIIRLDGRIYNPSDIPIHRWTDAFQSAAESKKEVIWELCLYTPEGASHPAVRRFGNFLWLDDMQRYPPGTN